MRSLDLHASLLLLVGIVSAQLPGTSLESQRSIVPNRFVVEFSSASGEGTPAENQVCETLTKIQGVFLINISAQDALLYFFGKAKCPISS